MTALIAFSTCPDAASATRIAEALVGEGLAACVNQVSGVLSTYRWQGAVRTDAEVLLVIKTTTARWDALKARLVALHPYAVPELVAWSPAAGHPAYLDWLAVATESNQAGGDRS